jgi:hypothetical protein
MLLAKSFVTVVLCCVSLAILLAGGNEPYRPSKGIISYEKPRTKIDLFMRRFGAETIRVFFFRQDGRWRKAAKPTLIVACLTVIGLVWIFV